jgi:hypothetical protein
MKVKTYYSEILEYNDDCSTRLKLEYYEELVEANPHFVAELLRDLLDGSKSLDIAAQLIELLQPSEERDFE